MSVALTSSPAPTSTRQEPLRVMVVDDSVVIRGMISRWIGTEPDMVVAASLRTGLDAVNQLERVKIKDPSFSNWPALSYAILKNIVPDFPLVNKSFNLSYAGNDL